MTVHINGSKGKELYYNGVKIKEAYYNGNKVYSSGPLYYCYSFYYGTSVGTRYLYTKNDYGNTLPEGVQVYGVPPYAWQKATSASQLSDNISWDKNLTHTRYPEGDLYT